MVVLWRIEIMSDISKVFYFQDGKNTVEGIPYLSDPAKKTSNFLVGIPTIAFCYSCSSNGKVQNFFERTIIQLKECGLSSEEIALRLGLKQALVDFVYQSEKSVKENQEKVYEVKKFYLIYNPLANEFFDILIPEEEFANRIIDEVENFGKIGCFTKNLGRNKEKYFRLQHDVNLNSIRPMSSEQLQDFGKYIIDEEFNRYFDYQSLGIATKFDLVGVMHVSKTDPTSERFFNPIFEMDDLLISRKIHEIASKNNKNIELIGKINSLREDGRKSAIISKSEKNGHALAEIYKEFDRFFLGQPMYSFLLKKLIEMYNALTEMDGLSANTDNQKVIQDVIQVEFEILEITLALLCFKANDDFNNLFQTILNYIKHQDDSKIKSEIKKAYQNLNLVNDDKELSSYINRARVIDFQCFFRSENFSKDNIKFYDSLNRLALEAYVIEKKYRLDFSSLRLFVNNQPNLLKQLIMYSTFRNNVNHVETKGKTATIQDALDLKLLVLNAIHDCFSIGKGSIVLVEGQSNLEGEMVISSHQAYIEARNKYSEESYGKYCESIRKVCMCVLTGDKNSIAQIQLQIMDQICLDELDKFSRLNVNELIRTYSIHSSIRDEINKILKANGIEDQILNTEVKGIDKLLKRANSTPRLFSMIFVLDKKKQLLNFYKKFPNFFENFDYIQKVRGHTANLTNEEYEKCKSLLSTLEEYAKEGKNIAYEI